MEVHAAVVPRPSENMVWLVDMALPSTIRKAEKLDAKSIAEIANQHGLEKTIEAYRRALPIPHRGR
jgi:hypothetical protein